MEVARRNHYPPVQSSTIFSVTALTSSMPLVGANFRTKESRSFIYISRQSVLRLENSAEIDEDFLPQASIVLQMSKETNKSFNEGTVFNPNMNR